MIATLVSVGLSAALSGAASAKAAVHLTDPSYDDKGGGALIYPLEPAYQARGLFDLRDFKVSVDGEDAVFEITLGAPVVRPQAPRITDAVVIPLDNNIYVQHIDIYIDRDPRPGAGHTEALPGRNVTLSRDGAWDQAVVITPRPYALRSSIEGWAPARDVITPTNVQSRGSVVVARVPLLDLGGAPQDHWGWQVMLSGALWVNGLQAYGRLNDTHSLNAMTMRVTPVAERFAFGGGDVVLNQPHVIDLLAPEGSTQKAILQTYSARTGALATVPMVYPDPVAFEAERAKALKALGPVAPTSAPALSALMPGATPGVVAAAPAVPEGHFEIAIKDVQDDVVVLEKPAGAAEDQAVKPFKVGTVVDLYGRPVGKVVITTIYPKFILATPIEGQPASGARVRFTGPQRQAPEDAQETAP